jgi:hypothetical protein
MLAFILHYMLHLEQMTLHHVKRGNVNRYQQCLQEAEHAKRRKAEAATGERWSSDKILDLDDVIYESTKTTWAIARRVFRSLPPNPHTKMIDIAMGQQMNGMDVPQTATLNILRDALQSLDKDLTNRQKQALAAYDEAIHNDLPPVTYVAEQLGIRVNSASELLKRAKIRTFGDFVHYIYDSVYKLDDWSPNPKQVKAMMKSKPRICAYCGEQTYDGSVPLCFSCHSRLGSLREETWDARTRGWLMPEIRRIENEHRVWAIDQLYKTHYGTVSEDEYEALANAA